MAILQCSPAIPKRSPDLWPPSPILAVKPSPACWRPARRSKTPNEDAGFAPGNRHAARLARRPEVAERIAELRAEAGSLADAGGPAVVAGLIRIVQAGEDLKTPAAMKEARTALVEAWKISLETSRRRQVDRVQSGLEALVKEEHAYSHEAYAKALRKWEASLA